MPLPQSVTAADFLLFPSPTKLHQMGAERAEALARIVQVQQLQQKSSLDLLPLAGNMAILVCCIIFKY